LSWLQTEFKNIPVSSDVFRCTLSGRDQKLNCLNSELWARKLRIEPQFPKISRDDFIRNKFGHSCFQGELCIQADGAVYPCIMDREHLLGRVTESSLTEILKGTATQSIWGLSKDHVDTCRDCEYRYACLTVDQLRSPMPK
jgi:radical SAM protein with 4Fe4S-binding SPASM domain